MGERISKLIVALGMSKNAFAIALSTSGSRISNITRGRNNPDSDILERIVSTYTNVNAHWLLTGEGEMFLREKNKEGGELDRGFRESSIDIVSEDQVDYFSKGEGQKKEDQYDIRHLQVEVNSLKTQMQLLSNAVDDLRMLISKIIEKKRTEQNSQD